MPLLATIDTALRGLIHDWCNRAVCVRSSRPRIRHEQHRIQVTDRQRLRRCDLTCLSAVRASGFVRLQVRRIIWRSAILGHLLHEFLARRKIVAPRHTSLRLRILGRLEPR
jgi:hypothetical protein